MAFIDSIPPQNADGAVLEMYRRQQGSLGYIPNYAKVFSHRPTVYAAWGTLLGSIRANLDPRRYELVTLAAAGALRSSYCCLAHGKILGEQFYSPAQVAAMMQDVTQANLEPVDLALMSFAEQVAVDATSVTAQDVQRLRDHGLTEAEIFDVAAVASARCFFSKLLDALGVEPDSAFGDLQEDLRQHLTVGRSMSLEAVERVS